MFEFEVISQEAFAWFDLDQLIEGKRGLLVLGLEVEAEGFVIAEVLGQFLVVEVREFLILMKHR